MKENTPGSGSQDHGEFSLGSIPGLLAARAGLGLACRPPAGQCRGSGPGKAARRASRQGREYRTEPQAREERTGLAGPGVALGWATRRAGGAGRSRSWSYLQPQS